MNTFFYGIIEGFYGRQWSWTVRKDYAAFLKQYGFDCYIYAPKGDAFLRSRWRETHSAAEWQEILNLRDHYRQQQVRWGMGLSPLGLSEQYTLQDRERLMIRVEQLNQLQPDILCILFDDVRGDIPGIAERQLAITGDILSVSNADQFIVCPTYYSFDPVLEQVFGTMPPGYFESLGQGLREDVGIFWTGNKVISDSYTQSDLGDIARLLQRKPILWDNYPVNDGRLTSQFLNIKPYTGRPSTLSNWVGGHLANPMNQPALSQLVLQSLALLYRQKKCYRPENAMQVALLSLEDSALASLLKQDAERFQYQGLAEMSEETVEQSLQAYSQFNHPVAAEVVDWLQGGYRFDPECLTG